MRKAFIDTSVILRILVKDDETKCLACKQLIKNARYEGTLLYLLPVTLLETVWVLEKVYRLERKMVRELFEAILNTPEFRCEGEEMFRKAIKDYEEKRIKFADAVMGYWGLEKDIDVVYTYDEKDFRKIAGLEVRKP